MRLIIAAAFAVTSTPSFAASVLQTYSAELPAEPFASRGLSFTLNRFDPQLGRLRAVEHRATVTYKVDIAWDLRGSIGSIAFYGGLDFEITPDLPNPFSFTLGSPSPGPVYSFFARPGTSGALSWADGYKLRSITVFEHGPELDSDLAFLTAAGALDFYIGSHFRVFGEIYSGDRYDPHSFGGISNYAGEWIYHYSVPEPATWAMMIAGFGLAGATMRSRKASAALGRAKLPSHRHIEADISSA
jgi:hypothetical protein